LRSWLPGAGIEFDNNSSHVDVPVALYGAPNAGAIPANKFNRSVPWRKGPF
jgi:hypothetical protein